MTDKKYCVYVHRNTANGKQYCGITSQKPEYRWRDGGGYTHNTHFQRAIQKYGWDAFEHIILKDGLTHSEANVIEQEYIRQYNLTDQDCGYNQTIGGDGTLGYSHTDETKQKMSSSRMGHECSTETCLKISEKNSGEKNGMYGATPWNKGVPMSDETKAKVSKNRRGKTSGTAHPMYGKKHTEESIKKMSESHKGAVPWNKGIKTNIRPKNARRVGMFNDSGELLQEFESVTAAAIAVGNRSGNISACCKGKVRHASGYVWKYLEKEAEQE